VKWSAAFRRTRDSKCKLKSKGEICVDQQRDWNFEDLGVSVLLTGSRRWTEIGGWRGGMGQRAFK
jgi:hypothetical protein